MSQKNILNEGLIDKIFDYIKARKVRKLDKIFKDKPDIRKKIKDVDKLRAEVEKSLKDNWGIEPTKIR